VCEANLAAFVAPATAFLAAGPASINDHGFRIATSDKMFDANGIGGITWSQRSRTWSVDPLRIPTVLRDGTAINWPTDINPASPWLRVRGGGAVADEDLVAVGVNSTEAAGATLRQRRTGRRVYLDNERRQLCHKLFRKDGESLVEALVSDEGASLADRCAAAYPTEAASADALPTGTGSLRTTPASSPPETTGVQDTAGFVTITTKPVAPIPSSA
jgi:hypothetical protein